MSGVMYSQVVCGFCGLEERLPLPWASELAHLHIDDCPEIIAATLAAAGAATGDET